MAVSAPFNTAAFAHQVAVSPLDVTMTISSGQSNICLIVSIVWSGAGVTITSVTWDQGGAGQAAMTSVGAALDYGAANVDHIQFFRLVNPTPGAAKTIRVVYSAAADMNACGAVYAGVDQTTPTANLTSNATGAPLAVTATSGDATTTAIGTSNDITSTAGSPAATVLIDTDPGVALAIGADYALATGTETHTWTASGSTQGVAGVAIQQAATGRTTHNTTSNPLGLALGTNRGIGA